MSLPCYLQVQKITDVSESGQGTVQRMGDFLPDVDVNLYDFWGVNTDSSPFSILDTAADSCA